MITMHKYPISLAGGLQFIEIEEGAIYHHVAMVREQLTLWAEVNTDAEKKKVEITVVGTGQRVRSGSFHMGTTQDGILVWHVFGRHL